MRFARIGFVSASVVLRRKQVTAVGGWPNMSQRVCCVIFLKHTKVMLSRRNNCARSSVSALQAIGYAEVALRLDSVVPPFELSLSELAEEAGPGYELAFFRLLKERIQPALSDRGSSLDIYGLQSCVRHLQSVKTWSRECSQLRNEIVHFLRAHLERAKAKIDLLLTIR